MSRKPSLIQVANNRLPFPTAARWAGIRFFGDAHVRGVKTHCPFGEFEHTDGGREPALRVYPDHGWCFAEQRYFSPVGLLAEVWGLAREDAAVRILKELGWRPDDLDEMWEYANRDKKPDLHALQKALLAFCDGRCPDWKTRQYDDEAVTAKLSECLGVLPLVETAEQCEGWLTAAKTAMGRVLPGITSRS